MHTQAAARESGEWRRRGQGRELVDQEDAQRGNRPHAIKCRNVAESLGTCWLRRLVLVGHGASNGTGRL